MGLVRREIAIVSLSVSALAGASAAVGYGAASNENAPTNQQVYDCAPYLGHHAMRVINVPAACRVFANSFNTVTYSVTNRTTDNTSGRTWFVLPPVKEFEKQHLNQNPSPAQKYYGGVEAAGGTALGIDVLGFWVLRQFGTYGRRSLWRATH